MKTKLRRSHILLLAAFLFLGYVFTNMFRTKRLSEKEKSTIPYTGNEVLVFQSNTAKLDTIRIRDITIREHPPNMGDMFWAKNIEILRVQSDKDCKNCDEIITVAKQNFSSKTTLSFDIILNGKRYYHGINFDRLNKLEPTKITIQGVEYTDIVLIDRNAKKTHSGHIDRLYWSVSKGIVRMDIHTDYYWELLPE